MNNLLDLIIVLIEICSAFLTASKMASPVNSVEDLAKEATIKYVTYCCGSTDSLEDSPLIDQLYTNQYVQCCSFLFLLQCCKEYKWAH